MMLAVLLEDKRSWTSKCVRLCEMSLYVLHTVQPGCDLQGRKVASITHSEFYELSTSVPDCVIAVIVPTVLIVDLYWFCS